MTTTTTNIASVSDELGWSSFWANYYIACEYAGRGLPEKYEVERLENFKKMMLLRLVLLHCCYSESPNTAVGADTPQHKTIGRITFGIHRET